MHKKRTQESKNREVDGGKEFESINYSNLYRLKPLCKNLCPMKLR